MHGSAALSKGYIEQTDCRARRWVRGCVPEGQGFYTPTAQNAIRQGVVAAENIAALICGSTGLKTFQYQPIGSLASLGQRQAIAEVGNFRFSGLPAWFAWRAIYLAKMPTLANKARVGLDWLKELITPVDTVQIPINGENVGGVLVPDAASRPPSVSRGAPPSTSGPV